MTGSRAAAQPRVMHSTDPLKPDPSLPSCVLVLLVVHQAIDGLGHMFAWELENSQINTHVITFDHLRIIERIGVSKWLKKLRHWVCVDC